MNKPSKMQSHFNSTENLNITYLLGAGASYNAIPIWKQQGHSMIAVAHKLINRLSKNYSEKPYTWDTKLLIDFFTKLKYFGDYAVEFGSIDIYARKLYLTGKESELNLLKHCLSVYFDIWENFYHLNFTKPDATSYEKIDKRYYSLLSVILEKSDINPKLNSNISFITWNYDLQLEMAYKDFMSNQASSFDEINSSLKFMNSEGNNVIHLNGFRGIFNDKGEIYENVEFGSLSNLENYLIKLNENLKDFKHADYSQHIKYAWENNSNAIEEAKSRMKKTNILIIIGYSFPAFNRKVDKELVDSFGEGLEYTRVIYQDPFANTDIINSIFTNPDMVELQRENQAQFYIPHEYLSPTKVKEMYF
ncbi:hypothetical protein KJK34_13255 [Flavobacterium sp. D11R37]|uniref:hypothetical protein n=1 Tax=Flavobacterium coralii TaxID=2838017 RepID=UPI001CA76C8B|nr:hypothetical protein [Flavobacterium coralii]MBY8963723.1 hypothetical protein [Flavobacterium coralii]